MAEHGRIQPAHAQRVQGRHHRTFAGIEAVPHRRPHVVQQAVARGPHQDRQPLPDIDHHQFHFAMARQVQRRMQQWQPQQQRQRLADTLALGCIVLLLLDPLAVLGAGFWLSFAGVAWLLWCLPPDQGRRRWAMLRGFVAAQAVATLGLLPLTVMLFGQASFAGPLANLAAVPWWSLVVIPLALLGVLAESLHGGWGEAGWWLSAQAFDLLWPALARIADSPLAMAWLPEPRWFALPLALLSAFWLLLPRLATRGRHRAVPEDDDEPEG